MKKPVLLLTIVLAAFLPLGTEAQKTDSAKKPSSFSAKVADNGKTLIADKECGAKPNSNHVGERDQ
jgi:hypothetical protein